MSALSIYLLGAVFLVVLVLAIRLSASDWNYSRNLRLFITLMCGLATWFLVIEEYLSAVAVLMQICISLLGLAFLSKHEE